MTQEDAMDIAALAIDVDHLVRPGGLLDKLEALLPEPVTDPSTGTTSHHKVTGSPAPWHAEAADVLLDIHEGARRLEASLKRDVSGRLGERRGASDGNTRAALKSIVRLAEALDEDRQADAARIVSRWVTAARQLRDIDEADRWEPLPRCPGELPPKCPWCDCFSLRMCKVRSEVRCLNSECVDERGRRPIARLEVGTVSGEPMLVFDDGTVLARAAKS